MPLHLNSIMNYPSSDVLDWITQAELQATDDVWVQDSKIYFLGSKNISDANTGKHIGKYVFTFFTNLKKQANELLDLDIVLDSNTPVELEFLQKHPQSSDANEYYEVQTTRTEQHFNIETVNRYINPKAVLNTTQKVYCSAFPFSLSIFDDIHAFNKFCGFAQEGKKVANTDITIHGFDETFISPGEVLQPDTNQQPWSFVVGVIKAYETVVLSFGNKQYQAIIAQVDTAVGILPTIIGNEVFDVSNIEIGKIIAMHAYIKANFSNGSYPSPSKTQPVTKPKKQKGWFFKK